MSRQGRFKRQARLLCPADSPISLAALQSSVAVFFVRQLSDAPVLSVVKRANGRKRTDAVACSNDDNNEQQPTEQEHEREV